MGASIVNTLIRIEIAKAKSPLTWWCVARSCACLFMWLSATISHVFNGPRPQLPRLQLRHSNWTTNHSSSVKAPSLLFRLWRKSPPPVRTIASWTHHLETIMKHSAPILLATASVLLWTGLLLAAPMLVEPFFLNTSPNSQVTPLFAKKKTKSNKAPAKGSSFGGAAMEPCPCGSEETYSKCCGKLHSDINAYKSATAEQVVRARYSAYAKKQVRKKNKCIF